MMDAKCKLIVGFIFALALCLVMPLTAYAHGAHIDYSINASVEIVARYDTGEPMAGAQVTVYAPGDPATPHSSGICDEAGRFIFVPDRDGTWDVQVRLSGHGDMVHIPVGEGMTTGGGGGGYSALQIVIMALCVIWGLIGTALYIRRRKA
jgi:nickel transport protein